MSDNRQHDIERIESYFSGEMSSEEKIRFEAELENDKALDELFRVYRTIDTEMSDTEKYSAHEAALRDTLQRLNGIYFGSGAPVIRISRRRRLYRIALSAAAVLILVLAGYRLFFQDNADPRQLANRYVKEELQHLSLTMDGSGDSLQQGIAAYNGKVYPKALQLFRAVYEAHPDNSDALKYTGITYLVTKEYEKAIACFEELADKKELFSNPGRFLKAVALLQRNQQGDSEQAEQLLQQVIDEKTDGSKEAARWLKQ
jgi:tetratricopeptide (TPR) repeat protein